MLAGSSTTESHPKPPMPIFYNCCERDSCCCIWWCRAAGHPTTRMKSFPLASTAKDTVLGILQTRFNLNAIFKGQPWKVLSTTALSFGVMVFLSRCCHFCKPSPRKDVWSLRVSICSCALSALVPLCLRQITSLWLVRFLARLFVRCYPVSHYWRIYYEQAFMEYL